MAVSRFLPSEIPDFITFLFSSKPKFDCYFIVGKRSLMEPVPERIGAVKMMLMAHSVVMRTALEDSELAEKHDVVVEDIYPDTFRNLLKFVYGYDTIGDLSFDEADNMLYAAEKYMMSGLKKKLATRLMLLLTPDNVCSLLNNPACYTELELNNTITKILRYETGKVLDSPSFLDASAESFLTILEQDGLAVPEVELWKAALRWAVHQGNSRDRQMVRQEISKVSKCLKICTLSAEEFCEEVASTQLLTEHEVNLVCQSIGRKRKLDELTEFCNEIKPRKRLHRSVTFWRRDESSTPMVDREYEMDLELKKISLFPPTKYCFNILTKQYFIELLPLAFSAQNCEIVPIEGWTCKMEGTIDICKAVIPNISDDNPFTVRFSKEVEIGKLFEIPLASDGKNVVLFPKSKYTVEITMKSEHYAFSNVYNEHRNVYENAHFVVAPSHHESLWEVSSPIHSPSPSFSDESSCDLQVTPLSLKNWLPFRSLIYRID